MKQSEKFLKQLDTQLSDQKKIEFAQFMKTYYPRDYVYYEARGATFNNQQMAGIFDFFRGVGNFVTGLFGEGVQGAYQEFVNWEQTGQTPQNAQQQLTQQDIYNIQKVAVDEALEQQKRESQSQMMPLYLGLAGLILIMVLKK